MWSVNTRDRFLLRSVTTGSQVLVLHYSLFGGTSYQLDARYLSYLRDSQLSLRVAFFQDEHYHTAQRFAFIDQYGIDWAYTCSARTWRPRYTAPDPRPEAPVHHPGYVGEIFFAMRRTSPGRNRSGRSTSGTGHGAWGSPPGGVARRRWRSAGGSPQPPRAPASRLDIATGESDRLYGDAWYRFLGVLPRGSRRGGWRLDLRLRRRGPKGDRQLAREPDLSFDEVSRRVLHRWEDNVPYRTISPRHLRRPLRHVPDPVRGSYSGLMDAGTHYIALRKDFANFDEVIRTFRDRGERAYRAAARRDLVESGR